MDWKQERLYELLEEIDQICRKHGIVYYMGGGAALGAIRNGGFMPWDDDIDLHITRDNWHKLIKALETELPPDREFICTETDAMYGNPLGRYVDKTTTAMTRSQLLTARACGTSIEFFIFDPMPKSAERKARHKMLVKTYCELLSPYAVANRNILYENPEFSYANYKEYLDRAEKEGMDKVLDELFTEIASVPEEESDAWYMVWARVNHQYPKEMFGAPRYVKFERGMFPVASMQEHIDRIRYGDSWMYVPHITGQIAHDTVDCELGIPYGEIVDIYMPLLDRDKLYNAELSKKRAKVDALEAWSRYRKEGMLLWFDILGKPVVEKCDSSAAELQKALDSGDYKAVESGIRDFMAVQERQHVKMNGLILPVSDEFLSVVFSYYTRTGQYYRVSGMVRARRESRRDVPAYLKAALDEFDYSRALSAAVYDDRDPEKVKALIGEHPEYEEHLDTVRAKLWIRSKRACSDDDCRALLDNALAAEQQFPEDGEIMRFAAFSLYKLGKKEEARMKYLEAVKHSRNGFVWNEARENAGIDGYELMGGTGEHEEAGDISDVDNMKFRMRKLKELLFEIDDICRENDLKYSLTQRMAISLQEDGVFPDEFNTICIAMPLGDLERLEHIVNDEDYGSRIVENIHNNPKADSLAARYVDTATTLIDFDDHGKHTYHGLYIDIRPIKQYDPENMSRKTYDFYRGLWADAVRDKGKKVTGLRSAEVKAALKFMGVQGITERYYQADREVSLVDSWEDIPEAPAIKCGAFSIRKKSYYSESRFRSFTLNRNWDVVDYIVDGHPVMYCSQFYGRHIRGGAHGTQWVLENQMVSPEPYSEMITGKTAERLKRVLSLRRRSDWITRPVAGYEKTIEDSWNIYLMAKEILAYEKRMPDGFTDQVADAVQNRYKEQFVALMEDYFRFLITWRNAGCPVVQIPELRKLILDAVYAFYPGMDVPVDAFEANDIDKLIVTHTFPYLDEEKQMARLIRAAGTGGWDLIAKEDRKAGEPPFIRSELGACLSSPEKAAEYIGKTTEE